MSRDLPVYYRVSDICEMTGYTPRTVGDWIRQGKLLASKAGGRNWLVKKEDFEKFFASRLSVVEDEELT